MNLDIQTDNRSFDLYVIDIYMALFMAHLWLMVHFSSHAFVCFIYLKTPEK